MIVYALNLSLLNLYNNNLSCFPFYLKSKIFLQFSLYGLQIALSERTITKDCAHHFLIATSKLPQDQIQAANSQKLRSPDIRREREKQIEKRKKEREGPREKCQDMTRAGE